MSPTDRKRRRGEWCRHFTGIQNKTCKVGIPYELVEEILAGMTRQERSETITKILELYGYD